MEDINSLPSLENSRRRARLGALATGVTATVFPAVLIIIIVTANISYEEEEEAINDGNKIDRYAEDRMSSGVIAVTALLVVCGVVHAGLSYTLWKGLREDLMWNAGAWIRCHAVWLACLIMGGGFLFCTMAYGHAPVAAGILAAATITSTAVGVGSGVVVRRHFMLLMPVPWWALCNLHDWWWRFVGSPATGPPVGLTVQLVEPFAFIAGGAPVTVQGGPPGPFQHMHTHPYVF